MMVNKISLCIMMFLLLIFRSALLGWILISKVAKKVKLRVKIRGTNLFLWRKELIWFCDSVAFSARQYHREFCSCWNHGSCHRNMGLRYGMARAITMRCLIAKQLLCYLMDLWYLSTGWWIAAAHGARRTFKKEEGKGQKGLHLSLILNEIWAIILL